MRRIIYITLSIAAGFLLMPSKSSAQGKDTAKVVAKPEPDILEYYTEPMPEFPGGGNEAMKKWIQQHVQYPKEATQKGIKGAVFVEVNVQKDGSLANISLLNHLDSACDAEALRIARAMPKWKPGLKNGKPVRVLMRFPVMFEPAGQGYYKTNNSGGQQQRPQGQQGGQAPQQKSQMARPQGPVKPTK